MSYSPPLLSRFQGSLCGRAAQRETLSGPQATDPPGERLYAECLHILIQQPTWDCWAFPQRLKPLSLATLSVEDGLLGIVPLMLYTHDTSALFSEGLRQLRPILNPTHLEVFPLWFRLLRHALQASDITFEAIAPDWPTPQLQQWLTQGKSWRQVQHQITRLPFPHLTAALYCFATTPGDYRLTVRRARQYSPTAAAIAATLSGAYNGMAQLPLGERNPECEQDAVRLYSRWMGTYLPPAHASPLPKVGAALTLQPRPMPLPVSLAGCEHP